MATTTATTTRPPWVPTFEQIEAFSREIVEMFRPEKVILFGSYAYGTPTDDSDVDILVVMETEQKPVWQAAEIRRATRHTFPLDLLVRTPAEFARRLAQRDSFISEIATRGRVLYEG